MAGKLFIVGSSLIALLIAAPIAGGDVAYRLAGIIAPSHAEMMAMIETPDGTQFLVRQGDVVGDAEVREITLAGALLNFPDRSEFLRLTGKNYVIEDLTDTGILASEFYQQIQDTPDLVQSGRLPGLADMQYLSADARVVAVNGLVVDDSEAGIAALRGALKKGHQIRVTLAGDTSVPIIYLGTSDSFDEVAADSHRPGSN